MEVLLSPVSAWFPKLETPEGFEETDPDLISSRCCLIVKQ